MAGNKRTGKNAGTLFLSLQAIRAFFLAGVYESTRYGVHRTIMDLECVTHG